MQVQPYLIFEGRCQEALDFYGQALGARVEVVMRYKDSPEPPPPGSMPPGAEDKVMHASFVVGKSTIMASDGHCTGKAGFQGFTLALSVADEPTAHRVFDALAAGGQTQMPLTKTFFSPAFGMVQDRFGVTWNVLVEMPQ